MIGLINKALLVSLFISLMIFGSCTENTPEKPNIVLILADDLGYETVSANGGESYQTPNIDRLATEGIRFEHCYAQPLCTPSRVKIMTGINNVRNYVRFGILDTSQVTFGHLFKEAGYATAVIGKWQLGKDPISPQRAGFDESCLWQVTEGRIDSAGRDTRFSQPVLETNEELKTFAEDDYGPLVVSQYGLGFIERSVREKKPFLLYYPMILTHCPFSPTPDSPEWMIDDTTVMKYKGHAHYFEDMMAYTDKIIGNIVSKLEELGVRDNTVILFTADNGTDVPVVSKLNGREVAGAKSKSTDGGTRVPLIVWGKNVVKPGLVSSDLIDLSDVLPTLCEAANISIPDSLDLDGVSFLPQLQGEEGRPRQYVYNWYSRNGDPEKARVFARNQRYKLYDTGEFYEIPEDYLEENPILFEDLGAETQKVYHMLQSVLNENGKRRLDAIPN